VKAVRDVSAAIDILAAGDPGFPGEHASFADAIDGLKGAAPLDFAQIPRPKALGYLWD
jgi:hypothetical protein